MKTILVPTAGSDTDLAVFETALAVARPFQAHLEFFHVWVGPGEAAAYTPHAAFARGAALRDVLDRLQMQAELRAISAKRHFDECCKERQIEFAERPGVSAVVSAGWRQEIGDPVRRLMSCARHHDLVVVGRPTLPNGLPPDLLELLLLGCGRPLLVAPPRAPQALIGTVMVCWKETPEAARAVTAAMPLLRMAERVVVLGVIEETSGSSHREREALDDVARQLMWHGIAADALPVYPDGRSPGEMLSGAARECGAGLIVMGGYGHRRMREVIFGGFTQAMIEAADLPVFILH